MIFDLKNLEVNVLKKFDGIYNYYNPSHLNGKTIFRRQSKYEDKVLVSDIVDENDNIILKHSLDDKCLNLYEDARFINDEEISVCVCRNDKNDLVKHINVRYAKYNLKTKKLTFFKTQNAHFEKHWQFYENKIIYHVNPYIIMDFNENILLEKKLNWEPWIEKYGNPGLSTNIFEVEGIKYLLFHSFIWSARLCFKYFIGLLRLNIDLSPLGYTHKPLFVSSREYTDNELLNNLWNWRKTELCEVAKYEVIFPMNVVIDNENINIYAGINDCVASNIIINKKDFIFNISKEPFILV